MASLSSDLSDFAQRDLSASASWVSTPTDTSIDWAKRFVSIGIGVIPWVYTPGNFGRPTPHAFSKLGMDAHEYAARDLEKINKFWTEEGEYLGRRGNPKWQVGVVPGLQSGIICIDIDTTRAFDWFYAEAAKNKQGEITFDTFLTSGKAEQWRKQLEKIPFAPGDDKKLHLWFRHPGCSDAYPEFRGKKLLSKIARFSEIGEGIDLVADAGSPWHITAPPSINPKRKTHVEVISKNKPIADLPRWLFEKIKAEELLDISKASYPRAFGELSKTAALRGKRAHLNRPRLGVHLLKKPDGKDTEWFKSVKKALKDKTANRNAELVYSYLFDETYTPQLGNRYNQLKSAVGTAVGAAFKVAGHSPEQVASLFYVYIVNVLNSSDIQFQVEPHPWEDYIWDITCWVYGKEEDTAKELAEETEVEKAQKESFLDKLIAVLDTWVKDPAYEVDKPAWILRNAILQIHESYFPLMPNGYYSENPYMDKSLIAVIRESGMGKIIPTTKMTKQGEVIDVAIQSLINNHVKALNCLEGHVSVMSRPGTFVDHGNKVAVRPLYWRNDELKPEFNPDVDRWLRAFFGPHQLNKGLAWIANAVAFEEKPICAIFLIGPPNSGKNLLARGLAETTSTGRLADGKQLTSRFQEVLMKAGVLHVEESFSMGKENPSMAFRRLVGGSKIEIDVKHQSVQSITNNVRLIASSNNTSIYKSLLSDHNMSQDDRLALLSRILHIDVQPEAAKLFQDNNGWDFSRGWVGGTQYKNEFILAKHFMYLYSIRHEFKDVYTYGGRFLVAGRPEESAMALKMVMDNNLNSDILCVIACLVAQYKKPAEPGAAGIGVPSGAAMFSSSIGVGGRGVTLLDGQVFVLSGTVYNALVAARKFNITNAVVGDALKQMTEPAITGQVPTRRINKEVGRWIQIPTHLVLDAASNTTEYQKVVDAIELSKTEAAQERAKKAEAKEKKE